MTDFRVRGTPATHLSRPKWAVWEEPAVKPADAEPQPSDAGRRMMPYEIKCRCGETHAGQGLVTYNTPRGVWQLSVTFPCGGGVLLDVVGFDEDAPL